RFAIALLSFALRPNLLVSVDQQHVLHQNPPEWPARQRVKNSCSTGVSFCAFTMWVWPSSVRRFALGSTSASSRMALRIQPGLLPPSITRVGCFTEAQDPAGRRLPC